MNDTLKKTSKNLLKDLLNKCTPNEQMMFKRMYSLKNLDLSINSVVDEMDDSKIDFAITQCENTISKKL